MEQRYHSRFEAYPFLGEAGEDLRCDFEIFTDWICSQTGLLRARTEDPLLREELLRVGELIYHFNPALRMGMAVTAQEVDWLESRLKAHMDETAGERGPFVLPQGSETACLAHILRVSCKGLVRLISRWEEAHPVEPLILDFANLLSGYFFALSLRLNQLDGVAEIPFQSRSYYSNSQK